MTTPARHGDPLTPHEIVVLELVAEGCTSNEAAHLLGCTYNSVTGALASTYIKLGAHSRTHAVVLAHRARLLNLNRPAATVRSAA